MSASSVVLGLDPGVARLGYGVVCAEDARLCYRAHGVLETPAAPLPERLLSLYRRVQELIAAHRPSVIAVEQLFFSRNVRTAISVGQARGVALLAAAAAGLPVAEYTPQQVKQAVSGYGGARKGQVQLAVRLVLGLDFTPAPDDAADALALAVCHLQWQRRAALVAAAERGAEP